MDPKRFEKLARMAQIHAMRQYSVYEQLAGITIPTGETEKV
jgi:hypothetical protein